MVKERTGIDRQMRVTEKEAGEASERKDPRVDLRNATIHVLNDMETQLAFLYQAEAGEDGGGDMSAAYEDALRLSAQVQEQFFDHEDGALVTELSRLMYLTPEEWKRTANVDAARRLLMHTAPLAARLYSSMDALALAHPDVDHRDIAAFVASRELEQASGQTHSIFGGLRALALHIEQIDKSSDYTEAWQFEKEVPVPSRILVEDPLDPKNDRVKQHWFNADVIRIRGGEDLTVPELSKSVSLKLKHDLEELAEKTLASIEEGDESVEAQRATELAEAYTVFANWVEDMLPFYDLKDGNGLAHVDFFHESFEQFHALVQSFEVLKMYSSHTQRLFMELCGVNARAQLGDDSSTSKYYGSVMHVALVNTQNVLLRKNEEQAEPGQLQEMRQLFDDMFTMIPLDEENRDVLTMEAILNLCKEAKGQIDTYSSDPQERQRMAEIALVAIAPKLFSSAARGAARAIATEFLAGAIRRELDELKKAPESVDLYEMRVLEGFENRAEKGPMYVFRMLAGAPTAALKRPAVRAQLGKYFEQSDIADIDGLHRRITAYDVDCVLQLAHDLPVVNTETGMLSDWVYSIGGDAYMIERRKNSRGSKEREQLNTFINDVWEGLDLSPHYLARARGFSEQEVQRWMNMDEYEYFTVDISKIPDGPSRQAMDIVYRPSEADLTVDDVLEHPDVIDRIFPLEAASSFFQKRFDDVVMRLPDDKKILAMRQMFKRIPIELYGDGETLYRMKDNEEELKEYFERIRHWLLMVHNLPPEQKEQVEQVFPDNATVEDQFWKTILYESRADNFKEADYLKRFAYDVSLPSSNLHTPVHDLMDRTDKYNDILWSGIGNILRGYSNAQEQMVHYMMGGSLRSARRRKSRMLAAARNYDKLFNTRLPEVSQKECLRQLLRECETDAEVREAFRPHVALVQQNAFLRPVFEQHQGADLFTE